MNEYRRTRRRSVAHTIAVLDAMTEQEIGRIGNLSENGLLLVGGSPLTEDALYQFRFTIGEDGDAHTVELGAHQLWSDVASVPGQYWVGFRFIDVAPEDVVRIREWIDAPGSHYA
ncbi:PilZ domain-containing protein [Coralloluteibacterium stylophorae]|uniref:PilZ domain-containing protein n=1 Tax=Coralloluteibacterium stylophorae TaxID=1776034 RepID=A0A8J8AYQ5_9GAMM|nr:PilZ domain-containing protein [Coralloluteibacterium stylophorae]MBS7458426.1 PilZ domain-containing protein [Coralloluteibacterium stylophorae]